MQTIRSVGVLSVAKILGVIYASMALILSPFLVLMGVLGAFADAPNNPFAAIGTVALVAMAVILPIFYGLMGFIFGAIGALLYNLLAHWLGGIQIELEAPQATTTLPPAA